MPNDDAASRVEFAVSKGDTHESGLSWKKLYLGAPDIAVARDKVVFNLGEHTGNIWMTMLPPIRD